MLPEEDRVTATGVLHKKFIEHQSSGSRDILVDRQTDRQGDHNILLPYRGGVNTKARGSNSASDTKANEKHEDK